MTARRSTPRNCAYPQRRHRCRQRQSAPGGEHPATVSDDQESFDSPSYPQRYGQTQTLSTVPRPTRTNPPMHLVGKRPCSRTRTGPSLMLLAFKAHRSTQLTAIADRPQIPHPQCPNENRATSRSLRCRQRSEEHTSELQSLMRISYAVFCLKKKKSN